jgi:hypothetical protein
MKRANHFRLLCLLLSAVALLAWGNAMAQATCDAGEYADSVGGVNFVYQIPVAFNGTLVVYAQGYADDSHGGQYTQTPYFLGDGTLKQALLDAGYMLAAAQYSLPDASACQPNGDYCQGRWAVPLGVASSAAIPARIAALQTGCNIQRKLIAGADMGGLVALQIAESPTQAASFDGALAMCTPGMGVSRWVDGLIDFAIVKKAATVPDYHGTTAVNDVPWPFDYVADGVRANLQNQVQSSSFFTRLEFQRLASGLPNKANNYYINSGPAIYAVTQLATELVADLQDQVGAPFGPLETLTGESPGYTLDAADLSYLVLTLGMQFQDVIDYLDAANALPTQLNASQTARNALYTLGEVTGALRIPALMVQNESEGVTPDWSLTHYREDVAASGSNALFYGTFASNDQHCVLTSAKVLTALSALGNWTATGIAPTSADFPAPDFDAGHVPADDPRNRVNVWIGNVTTSPGADVQHVQAKVLRSNTGSALSLAFATSGGYVTAGTIDFPAGGNQSAVIALDVPANRDQAVSLALMQVSGPANVIMPQTVLLPATAEYIFANGFE